MIRNGRFDPEPARCQVCFRSVLEIPLYPGWLGVCAVCTDCRDDITSRAEQESRLDLLRARLGDDAFRQFSEETR